MNSEAEISSSELNPHGFLGFVVVPYNKPLPSVNHHELDDFNLDGRLGICRIKAIHIAMFLEAVATKRSNSEYPTPAVSLEEFLTVIFPLFDDLVTHYHHSVEPYTYGLNMRYPRRHWFKHTSHQVLFAYLMTNTLKPGEQSITFRNERIDVHRLNQRVGETYLIPSVAELISTIASTLMYHCVELTPQDVIVAYLRLSSFPFGGESESVRLHALTMLCLHNPMSHILYQPATIELRRSFHSLIKPNPGEIMDVITTETNLRRYLSSTIPVSNAEIPANPE